MRAKEEIIQASCSPFKAERSNPPALFLDARHARLAWRRERPFLGRSSQRWPGRGRVRAGSPSWPAPSLSSQFFWSLCRVRTFKLESVALFFSLCVYLLGSLREVAGLRATDSRFLLILPELSRSHRRLGSHPLAAMARVEVGRHRGKKEGKGNLEESLWINNSSRLNLGSDSVLRFSFSVRAEEKAWKKGGRMVAI